MEKGSKTLFSQRGREDLRGQLAAMRKLAWRLGWLDRSIYPPGDRTRERPARGNGAVRRPRLRPETRQVRATADAADRLCGPEGTDPLMTRLPLFGTKIRVAGFGGLRLGEQNALRAIDVFVDRGYVYVNGSWITPRGQAGFRGPVKNHALHEVPLPKPLMHDELLPRVKELLGLPAKASLQEVVNAQEAERQRRASLAAREKTRNLAWWNYPVPPEDELWLFVDTVTGLPVKPEMHNERWHRVRKWVDENEPTTPGPRRCSYGTLLRGRSGTLLPSAQIDARTCHRVSAQRRHGVVSRQVRGPSPLDQSQVGRVSCRVSANRSG